MFVNSECQRNSWNGNYSKINNCLESANIFDFAVMCHFNYKIDNFWDIYKDRF